MFLCTKTQNGRQVDITNGEELTRQIRDIARARKVDYVFHCAVYYDYYLIDSPVYDRVNVCGTENLLKSMVILKPRRFVLASSLAVTDFLNKDRAINESSPTDADDMNPYVRTKKICKQLVRDAASQYPCTIVRMPATFTDWCEHPPLYSLLKNWFEEGWYSNLIVGRGITAIPYIHADDLNRFLQKMFEADNRLNAFEIFLATPNQSISHRQLFHEVKKLCGRDNAKPVHCSIWLAWLSLSLKNAIGRITGDRPFEQPWMLRYVDRRMQTDASRTKALIRWKTRPCHDLTNRLFQLSRNMHKHPDILEQKNGTLLKKTHLKQK